ncbi:hypothetical protein, partial [Rhodoplanes sp. SY1]|uniref:hypothetical protein n=1 Tax=Rhodoplanes sp. SY1 TaxID=3166646 RepID=UPI0038B42EC2
MAFPWAVLDGIFDEGRDEQKTRRTEEAALRSRGATKATGRRPRGGSSSMTIAASLANRRGPA